MEAEIQWPLRATLEQLLAEALDEHPAPSDEVSDDTLAAWLYHRAYDLYRGGNNVFGVPAECVAAVQAENTDDVRRMQGFGGDALPVLHARCMATIRGILLGQDDEITNAWRQRIHNDRLRKNIITITARIQRDFGDRIELLREKAASKRLAS